MSKNKNAQKAKNNETSTPPAEKKDSLQKEKTTKVENPIDPTVEETSVETVEEQKLEETVMTPVVSKGASMDAIGIYLASAMNYYGKPSAEDDAHKVVVHKMLDINNVCFLARLTMQNPQELKELGAVNGLILNIPETEIKQALEMFSGLGINAKVLPSSTKLPEQTQIAFGKEDMTDEGKKLAIDAAKSQRKTPDLNPFNWDTPEKAKEAILYQLNNLDKGASSALVGAYTMFRIYSKNLEENPKEQDKWSHMSNENLIDLMFKFLGYNQRIQLTRGIGSVIRGTLVKGLSVLAPHSTVHKNFTSLSESDTAGVLKGLLKIVILQDNPEEDLSKNKLIEKLTNTSQEEFLGYLTKLTDADKEMFGRFYGAYRDEFGPDNLETNPTLPFKMFTKMVDVANLYLSPDTQIKYIEQKEFADVLTKFVEDIEKDEKNSRHAAFKALSNTKAEKVEEKSVEKKAEEPAKKPETQKTVAKPNQAKQQSQQNNKNNHNKK